MVACTVKDIGREVDARNISSVQQTACDELVNDRYVQGHTGNKVGLGLFQNKALTIWNPTLWSFPDYNKSWSQVTENGISQTWGQNIDSFQCVTLMTELFVFVCMHVYISCMSLDLLPSYQKKRRVDSRLSKTRIKKPITNPINQTCQPTLKINGGQLQPRTATVVMVKGKFYVLSCIQLGWEEPLNKWKDSVATFTQQKPSGRLSNYLVTAGWGVSQFG